MEVANYYDEISKGYDELYGEEQRRKYFTGLKMLKPSERVLDVGCGTGLLIDHISFTYYLGVDISRGMIEKAKRRRRGLSDLVIADAQALPLRSNAFETCYSFTVLQNLRDPESGLREILRVCKKALVSSLRGRGLKRDDCIEVPPDVICLIER